MSVRLGRYDGTSSQNEIEAWDAIAGAPTGTGRMYLDLEDNFTGGYVQYCFAHDKVPNINIHSWNAKREPVKWLDVFHGLWDGHFLSHFTDFKALPGRNVAANFVFHHEPENEEDGKVSGDISGTCGTRADFALAAGHVRDLMRSVLTADEAQFGVTLMAGSYKSGRWTQWVPPVYAFLGIDGYSHGTVSQKTHQPEETFASIITPAHDAAVSVGKKLFIQETGCAEVPGFPTFKTDYFLDARSLTKTWPECIGIQYSNVNAKNDYRIDTSPASLAAFQAWAADPVFQGAWT